MYVVKNKKEPKLSIDETGIVWLFEDLENEDKVDWKELMAVRIEEERIVLYIASSICRAIDLKLFENEDRIFLKKYIAQIANQRKVDFFNASKLALA